MRMTGRILLSIFETWWLQSWRLFRTRFLRMIFRVRFRKYETGDLLRILFLSSILQFWTKAWNRFEWSQEIHLRLRLTLETTRFEHRKVRSLNKNRQSIDQCFSILHSKKYRKNSLSLRIETTEKNQFDPKALLQIFIRSDQDQGMMETTLIKVKQEAWCMKTQWWIFVRFSDKLIIRRRKEIRCKLEHHRLKTFRKMNIMKMMILGLKLLRKKRNLSEVILSHRWKLGDRFQFLTLVQTEIELS